LLLPPLFTLKHCDLIHLAISAGIVKMVNSMLLSGSVRVKVDCQKSLMINQPPIPAAANVSSGYNEHSSLIIDSASITAAAV
jgi:hypothetical protein